MREGLPPPPPVPCQVSYVMCHVSHVMCHISHDFSLINFLGQGVKIVGGGCVINDPTRLFFKHNAVLAQDNKNISQHAVLQKHYIFSSKSWCNLLNLYVAVTNMTIL